LRCLIHKAVACLAGDIMRGQELYSVHQAKFPDHSDFISIFDGSELNNSPYVVSYDLVVPNFFET